jgi:hypothetical protein
MFLRKLFVSAVLSAASIVVLSAATVKGVVRDSVTGEALPFVSIVLAGGNRTLQGGITDGQGFFSLPNASGATHLVISFLGYKTCRIPISSLEHSILLSPIAFTINEVTVRPQRERYRRRGNPAVDLARQVIAHKESNRIEAKAYYSVSTYEKLSLAWDDFRPNLDKGLLRRFSFLKNYTDTSALSGRPILTLSVRETLSEQYYRRSPHSVRKHIKGVRQEGIDQSIDQNGTLTANMREIFRPTDIFENDITILLNRFVSPLHSLIGISYYHYYITDTTVVEGDSCATLSFVPANSEGYGFTGKMAVTLDGRYAVRQVQLNLSYRANINWVDQLRIEQHFRPTSDGTWALSEENTHISFVAIEGAPRIYAHQLRHYSDYSFSAVSDSLFQSGVPAEYAEAGAESLPDTFWRATRPIALREREDVLSSLLAELRRIPLFNGVVKTCEILISGYIPTRADQNASRFDIGPMNTLLSRNPVEGYRLRIGGTTTAHLHPHLFAGGFLAYGSDDRRFKYQTNLTYSFTAKRHHEHESPINALSFLCEYDIHTLGQNYLYTSKDNMFLTLPNGDDASDRMQYIRKASLSYERDFPFGLSVRTWLQRSNNEAAGSLYYMPIGAAERLAGFTTSEAGLRVRYAPGESTFNSRRGKTSRLNLSKDAPVVTVTHYAGMKGPLGGQYAYHHSTLSAEKRIWLSSFGHIDAKVQAGAVWNAVPYPLLIHPNTNQSITIQPESFTLLRPLEFVADRYASLHATYYLKGWILNRTPVLKWLRLREVLSVNAFFGTLTDRNNPEAAGAGGSLFHLPEGVRASGRLPYVEASVGVENIFKVLRLDYYRRLTYLTAPAGGHPPRRGGVRLALRFSF